MRIEVLGCAAGAGPGRRPSAYLVGDRVAVDAGSLADTLEFDAQARLEHVFLTHCHLDHVCSLPLLIDNRMALGAPALHVYGLPQTLRSVEEHFFNNEIWPTVEILNSALPTLEFHPVTPGTSLDVAGMRVTPRWMEHPVPCVGFDIESSSRRVLIAGDTGTIASIQNAVGDHPIDAVVLEVSWPDRLADLARRAMHLTPCRLDELVLHESTRLFVTHAKPPYFDEVAGELASRPHAEMLTDGLVIEFPEDWD